MGWLFGKKDSTRKSLDEEQHPEAQDAVPPLRSASGRGLQASGSKREMQPQPSLPPARQGSTRELCSFAQDTIDLIKKKKYDAVLRNLNSTAECNVGVSQFSLNTVLRVLSNMDPETHEDKIKSEGAIMILLSRGAKPTKEADTDPHTLLVRLTRQQAYLAAEKVAELFILPEKAKTGDMSSLLVPSYLSSALRTLLDHPSHHDLDRTVHFLDYLVRHGALISANTRQSDVIDWVKKAAFLNNASYAKRVHAVLPPELKPLAEPLLRIT